MDWKTAVAADGGAVTIPKRWLHIHYYEALNILFRSENALRTFVYVILKNEKQEAWPETNIQVAEGEQGTISSVAARRINQAKGFGYLGYEITSPLMHLNSGELSRLILSDALWPLFQPFFKGKKEIIRTKLDEINAVRNALAHFRPIKPEDIDLIKQNIRHAFVGIEECLRELIGTRTVVPTNTTEKWYQLMSTLQAKRSKVSFHQSLKEDWIRIQLEFDAEILTHQSYGDWWSYKLLSIATPSIPKHYANLRRFCTYVGEFIPYASVMDKQPDYKKEISVVSSRKTLTENVGTIHADIAQVLATIDEESDLLQQDHLARGKLVETTSGYMELRRPEKGDAW